MYRRWKDGKTRKEEYIREKKKWKKFLEEKREKKRKEEELDLRKVRNEKLEVISTGREGKKNGLQIT